MLTNLHQGTVIAFADLKAVYTWKTWLFGWLVRVLSQVLFYAMIGVLLGDPEQVRFLVLGNAVMCCAVEVSLTIASTSWDRNFGTTPLLAGSPMRPGWLFFGRSLQWPLSGSVTSLVALFTLAPLFGVHWSPAQVPLVVGLVFLIAFSVYAGVLFVAALVLTVSSARNVVLNLNVMVMMAVCGVQVPLDFWPEPVQWFAAVLPLTHGIEAVRALEAGGALTEVVREAALTGGLGLVWFLAASVAFRAVFGLYRRGTVEL